MVWGRVEVVVLLIERLAIKKGRLFGVGVDFCLGGLLLSLVVLD